VRVLLGLSWLTESWNLNQSPPGGLLRFELSHAASGSADAKYVILYTAMFACVCFSTRGSRYVKIFFESQSMVQQRNATQLSGQPGSASGPSRVFAAIPGCAWHTIMQPLCPCAPQQITVLCPTTVNLAMLYDLLAAGVAWHDMMMCKYDVRSACVYRRVRRCIWTRVFMSVRAVQSAGSWRERRH
jgi:hypothetical protein